MKVTYVSPSVERLVGEPIEAHLQRTMEERFPPDSLDILSRAFAEEMEKEKDPACDKKRSRLIEVQHYRADGTPIWVSINISFVRDENGNPIGFQGVTRDISALKRAEEERERLQVQLLQAQKLEAVGRLAGGVAHDFNNMLGVILGYSEMAQAKMSHDDLLHDDLTEIITAARRSADITRQLLAFARQQTMSPKMVDLNETVEGMLRMLRRLIGEDINLQWLPKGKLWRVKIDPSRIDQILANLCLNGRDAIAGVGKITIETDNVHFGRESCTDRPDCAPGEYAMLAVSDDGCGMDEETRRHLFEPFFTTKEVGKGTGLGLATVYGIVRQNDGFIDVDSEPGQGTTFKIYFPRHTGPAEVKDVEATTDIPSGNGETVLMVEDEASVLKLGQTMLASLGYRVLAAAGTTEAIALAQTHAGKIHLLITDVVMPEMNGRDLAVQLQKRFPDLRVLFMSGYTANVIAHHGVLDEGTQFIQKPFSREELAVKVREVLEKESPQ
jgi:PAS domain S-box-containing protein